jgi:glutamate synthase (NADPH/NADH) large chain
VADHPHGQSDTASLDNALELLVAGGYPLVHAMMMLIPEAWAGNPLMDPPAAPSTNITPR